MTEPYPLLLEPILKPKVWGGRRLADYGKMLPPVARVGESWEVADLSATSPGGGGGGPARSLIDNGALAGRRLHDALDHWGSDLVGAAWSEAEEFPLLVKLLDASEHLSVQVHPTEAYALAHPGAHVKSESWFIIDATPEAELYLGLRPGVGRDDVRAAIDEGRVPEVLRTMPAIPGTCHHLPSGTVHTLGAGVLVAEIQSPSDTTFRLYDWADEYARPPRDLHIDEAIDSMRFDDPPAATRLPTSDGMVDLTVTDRYVLRGARGLSAVRPLPGTCTIVTSVDANAAITHRGSEYLLPKGTTSVIPAAAAGETVIDAHDATVLIIELAS